ncbi:MAG: serine/threonine-protein kinase [Polyangiaceae bacterium]
MAAGNLMTRAKWEGEGEGGAHASRRETESVSSGDSGDRIRRVIPEEHPEETPFGWEGLTRDEPASASPAQKRTTSKRRAVLSSLLVDGKYRLVRHVARGGMGSIWEARDVTRGEMRLALKVMTAGSEAAPEAKERFRREIALASGLVGPHFPRVHGYGLENEAPYLALEFLEGETLSERIRARGRLSIEECRWLARELCEALTAVHEFGIVHRDITPRNLMIVPSADGEILKVLDLGIARHALFDSKLTRPGMLVGSPRYMSPEQVANRDVDARSDLWSAACVIYRALVGADPFPGKDEIASLEWALSRPAVPPSTVLPELGPAVDAFFAIALSRRPADRFASARELGSAFLGATLGGPAASVGVEHAAPETPPAPAPAAQVVEGPMADSVVTRPDRAAPPRARESTISTGLKTRQFVRRDLFAGISAGAPRMEAPSPHEAPGLASPPDDARESTPVPAPTSRSPRAPLLALLAFIVFVASVTILAEWLR